MNLFFRTNNMEEGISTITKVELIDYTKEGVTGRTTEYEMGGDTLRVTYHLSESGKLLKIYIEKF